METGRRSPSLAHRMENFSNYLMQLPINSLANQKTRLVKMLECLIKLEVVSSIY